MIFTLRQPQSFSEIGRKDNQEDYLWPLPANVTADQRVFIMCDGVGGQEKGEVASQSAATGIGEYLTQHWPADGVVTKAIFNEALAAGYRALDEADNGSDSVRKMGTTMTCLVLHEDGALLAHIGDSRIYHLRPSLTDPANGRSGILHQTRDHSLVNDLLRVGEITEEEAANFPHKNIITRAMQPCQERPCRADVVNIDDIKPGDYFFLCSDGVLEQVSNAKLEEIVADARLSDEEKIAAILEVCRDKTRDNHTCWLVPIADVEGVAPKAAAVAEATIIEDVVEEDADAEIEDVADDEPTLQAEVDASTAVEDDEEENTPEAFLEPEPKGFLGKVWLRCRKAGAKIAAFCRPCWERFMAWFRTTKVYKNLAQTNRWHWIIMTIAFLAVYDLVLFFFGDTSYSIIFPKVTPSENIDIVEKPKLIEPEVQEYEAPKPSVDKDDDKKNKEIDDAVEKIPLEIEEVPASVNTETEVEPDVPTSSEIKMTAPKIEVKSQPTE